MSKSGILIALAYPDHFVRATEGKYNEFLRWVGIVNKDYVRAGHSALALIQRSTGRIFYADFGRYLTPYGHGRARTYLTDPELHVDFLATFNNYGECDNLEDILNFFDTRPQLTHGSGRCYAGVFDVDFESAWEYIFRTNQKGSIKYGPFQPKGNNCSRFTWNALRKSCKNPWLRFKLYYRFVPSIMPLDLVMSAPNGRRFLVENGRLHPVKFGQWDIWLRLWEKYGGESQNHLYLDHDPELKGNWIESVGDRAFFAMVESFKDTMLIERRDERLRLVFRRMYNIPGGFDPEGDFEFTYDSHAQFCTLLQNDNRFVAEVVSAHAVGRDASSQY